MSTISINRKIESGEENKMDIVTFSADMQPQINRFFEECFSAVGIPYSPENRHADVADVESHYMQNGCFWCLVDGDTVIGTAAIRALDANEAAELKRMFVLPEYRGMGVAQAAIRAAEVIHGGENWLLLTILQEPGNCHLYEKMGYRQTSITKVINDRMTLVIYEK